MAISLKIDLLTADLVIAGDDTIEVTFNLLNAYIALIEEEAAAAAANIASKMLLGMGQ